MIDSIINCLDCSMKLAIEFSDISHLEWSIKSKLNNFNLAEKKMILYVTNKNHMKDCKLEKFNYKTILIFKQNNFLPPCLYKNNRGFLRFSLL